LTGRVPSDCRGVLPGVAETFCSRFIRITMRVHESQSQAAFLPLPAVTRRHGSGAGDGGNIAINSRRECPATFIRERLALEQIRSVVRLIQFVHQSAVSRERERGVPRARARAHTFGAIVSERASEANYTNISELDKSASVNSATREQLNECPNEVRAIKMPQRATNFASSICSIFTSPGISPLPIL